MAAGGMAFLKEQLWVIALAVSLCSISLMYRYDSDVTVSLAAPPRKPADMSLLQSGHRITKLGTRALHTPGSIQWVGRDPYLDKDYPKDEQPGEAPETPTEAPIEPIDTRPAPSKTYPTPAPAPKLVVGATPEGNHGPPWKWSSRDPYLDDDFTKDDQPTAPSPGLFNLLQTDPVVETTKALELREPAELPNATGEAAGETKPAESADAEAPGSLNSSSSNSSNLTTTAPAEESNSTANSSAPAEESNSTANTTQCATRTDARATSWLLETAPEGTPCIFGLDDRDEGAHCILENEEYGSNGWCYTAKDLSQWGSCNDHCPLQGQNAQLGEHLDGLSEAVHGVSEKVGSTTDADSSKNEAATAV